jgi:hypothetical protein
MTDQLLFFRFSRTMVGVANTPSVSKRCRETNVGTVPPSRPPFHSVTFSGDVPRPTNTTWDATVGSRATSDAAASTTERHDEQLSERNIIMSQLPGRLQSFLKFDFLTNHWSGGRSRRTLDRFNLATKNHDLAHQLKNHEENDAGRSKDD